MEVRLIPKEQSIEQGLPKLNRHGGPGKGVSSVQKEMDRGIAILQKQNRAPIIDGVH